MSSLFIGASFVITKSLQKSSEEIEAEQCMLQI